MKTANISDESKALHKLYREGEIDDQTLEDSMNAFAFMVPPNILFLCCRFYIVRLLAQPIWLHLRKGHKQA